MDGSQHSRAVSVIGLRHRLMTSLASRWVEVSGLLVHSEGVSLLLFFRCVCVFDWLWFSWSGSCKGIKSELGYEWVALKMN